MQGDPFFGWRVKKEISTGDIIVAVGLVASAFLWASKIDTRIAVLEDRVSQQAATDGKQDGAWREAATRIEQRMAAMDAKIDRLIELQIGSRTVTGI